MATVKIHPERLAESDELVREVGRCNLVYDGPPSKQPKRRLLPDGRRPPKNKSHIYAAFRDVMPSVLAMAQSCRIFNTKEIAATEEPDVSWEQMEAWLDAYVIKGRGSWQVKLTTEARADIDFWWWLVECTANPMILVRPGALKEAELFATLSHMEQATLKYTVTSSAQKFARQTSRRNDLVVIVPVSRSSGRDLELALYAKPDRVVGLARRMLIHLLEHRRVAKETREHYESIDTSIFSLGEGTHALYFTERLEEPRLMSQLKRGMTKLGDKTLNIETLAFGELLAVAEGRGTVAEGHAHAERIQEALDALEPPSDEMITLARQAVEAVFRGGIVMRKLWLTKEANAQWAAEVRGLADRLTKAETARAVRRRAANAAPSRLTKRDASELIRPENFRELKFHALLDDAVAVVRFAIEHTGAIVLHKNDEGRFDELSDGHELRGQLDRALGGFDARKLKRHRDHETGVNVYLWWKDVCEAPTLVWKEPDSADHYLHTFQVDAEPLHGVWRIVGWGAVGRLRFSGAAQSRIFRSEFEYPTGTELKLRRYQREGPWRDVDWKLLKRKITAVRAFILKCPMRTSNKLPILAHAAARIRRGWLVADANGLPVRMK